MHRLNRYLNAKPDFEKLAAHYPDFAPFVTVSEAGYASINFQDVKALRALTRVLLKEDWGLDVELREDRLCPTLANRLDYVLNVLDLEPYLRARCWESDIPERSDVLDEKSKIRVLDIGTGHIAIYLLLLSRLRPEATLIGTEPDPTSLHHAQDTLNRNDIPSSSIRILPADIVAPILEALSDNEVDIIICNPPFFSSAEEVQEGEALKADPAHAAPTAADNELITPGGEVEFVGKIIRESTRLQDRCKWFTSLLGKYSSLQPLVDLLRSFKVDNYFVKSVKQAKTARWILGWSYGSLRIPDSLTRPENLIVGTSFARTLPPPNRLTHVPLHPPLSVDQLRETILPVLKECQLDPETSTPDSPAIVEKGGTILLSPRLNTWSRSARRDFARQAQEKAAGGDADTGSPARAGVEAKDPIPNDHDGVGLPVPRSAIMVARILFILPSLPSESARGEEEWRGSTLALDWLGGSDRSLVDSFWKYLCTKAGLLGVQGRDKIGSPTKSGEQSASTPHGADGVSKYGGRGRGRGRDKGWRGRRGG